MIARRTRFGRYVFATGGNPDAAELSGVDTKLLTVKIFALLGALCALSALVASARLANHTNDIGTLDELRVIAAAVIGGTALSGGIGTIYGAILGALIMQSLQSGMAMVGVDAPFQNIVVGGVLVLAVLIDILYRRRTGARGMSEPKPPVDRSGTPLVAMRDISIAFGGVRAVDDVSVDLWPGEVVGLLGHNGAGKSTLIKILSGAYQADSGTIEIEGRPVTIRNPRDARAQNVETIYQTLALADNLDAAANVFLGREITGALGLVDDDAMEAETAAHHGPPQPQLLALRRPRGGALGRPAAVGGHRARGLLRRAHPHHGRADGCAGAAGDQDGLRTDRPAQGRRHRHLSHLPRHPRGHAALRPRLGDEERQAGRHGGRGRGQRRRPPSA